MITISDFKGVDLYNAPANVDDSRSPEAPNMIRDVPGKVRKRMGYKLMRTYPSKINGVYTLGKTVLVHSGNILFESKSLTDESLPINHVGKILSGTMYDSRSKAWEFDKKLYILDGWKFYVYGEFEENGTKEYKVKEVTEVAYVPTIIISRNPEGGGTTLEPINLIQNKWTESFLGKAGITVYQLTADNIDNIIVKAKKLNADGSWTEMKENTDFSVNRKTGQVTFTTAPGASPVAGHDNVEITASKKRDGYFDRINKCTVSTLFGVNGAADRLFVTGNPNYPNQDWYSAMNNPTYFGDIWYSVLGQGNSAILGYSVINDRLAAHKNEGEDGRNVILRQGVLLNDKAAFPITNTLQGKGAIAKNSFAYLSNEPLFLTDLGVMAITAADVTGEKYSQNRSFYINNALTKEAGLKDAFAFIYKDFYMLCVNSKVYVLDGLQKTYEKNTPYSTYQYECYYLLNVNAYNMWEIDGDLWFGTSRGQVMKFYSDSEKQLSYNDNGETIEAHWDIPDIDGRLFYKNKTFRRIIVRLASAAATGIKIYVQKKGIWNLIVNDFQRFRFFTFDQFLYSHFTYATDNTPKTLTTKIRVKKVDKARYRLENNEINQPFGIYSVALEYTENGEYKG